MFKDSTITQKVILMDKKIRSKLSSVGLKVTEARCAILRVLAKNKSPQNYEQIKKRMLLSIDKATFYRNMQTFEEKGLINKFESEDRVWHYELGKRNHAHFMCSVCKKILCLNLDIPNQLNMYEITSITFKGICKNCLKKEKS